jgi:hypothetical protein
MKKYFPTLNRKSITTASWKFENQRFSTIKILKRTGGISI